MKKVINNKLYDTTTAKELGSDSYLYPGDFHHWVETLYRKKTGEYFLHGEGGAASRYAEAVSPRGWVGGEKIIPLSEESARAWVEEHLDADDYEAIFGEVSEDDDKIRIGMQVSSEWWEKVKEKAKEAGKSATQYVIDCVKI